MAQPFLLMHKLLSGRALISLALIVGLVDTAHSQPTSRPRDLRQVVGEGINQTPARGPLEPGGRDPEVQRRFDEMRRGGVPMPNVRYIRDLPPEIRNMFPRDRWNDPVPAMVPDEANPNSTRLDRPPTVLPRLDRDADDPVAGGGFPWMHWWEANRERYWPQRPGRPQRDTGAVPSRVFAALRLATSSKDTNVRAQAALTLAMVQHPQAMELLPKLTTDPSDGVAMHAWAAMGLLNTKEATAFLETPPKAKRDIIGWTLAVGLSDKPTEAMWNAMPGVVDDAKAPDAQRLALWALRMHKPLGARELLLTALNNTTDPVFHAEIFRGLARINHPEDVANLINIARENFGAVTWEYVAWLHKAAPNPSPGRRFTQVVSIPEKLADPVRVHTRMFDKMIKEPGRIEDPLVEPAEMMLRSLQLPAVAALAEMDSPSDSVLDALRDEFRKFMTVRLQDGRVAQQVVTRGEIPNLVNRRASPPPMPSADGERVALLGLGRLGTGDDARLANNILAMNDAVAELNQLPSFAPNDPLRGIAAVAQGLYLYNGGLHSVNAGLVSSVAGRRELPGTGDLFNYYQMPTESMELRTACAVAIGLSGNTDFVVRMKQSLESLKPGQEVIWGFAIWALGMLGDPQAVDLAARHIGPPRQFVDVSALLARPARPAPMDPKELIARRAAVDGLAALGDARALPLLYGEWGKNPFLDLEVARAIARCLKLTGEESLPGQRLDPFIEAMLRLMEQDRHPDLAASAIVSLGALYERQQRARLGELIAGVAGPIFAARRLQDARMDLDRPSPEAVLSLGNPFQYFVLRRAPQAPQQAPRGR